MSDGPHIIAYATAAGGAGGGVGVSAAAERGEFFASFAPPPAWWQFSVSLAAAIVCAVGAAFLLVLGLMDTASGVWLAPIVAAVLVGCTGLERIPTLRRLRRYGEEPVTIEVGGRRLTVRARGQCKAGTLELDVCDVRRITLLNDGRIGGGARTFRIVFHRGGWLSAGRGVSVAVHDRGVINRAVADLRRAVAVAAAAEPATTAMAEQAAATAKESAADSAAAEPPFAGSAT